LLSTSFSMSPADLFRSQSWTPLVDILDMRES
jgi:hypothetical protein